MNRKKKPIADSAPASTTIQTILIVEDDKGLSKLLVKIIEHEGFSTEQMYTGKEAIAWLVDHPHTLLLLDYHLPDMNGKEVIESLEQQGCTVPFITMTGHGDERIAVEMLKLGALDYLIKEEGFINRLPSVIKHILKQLETEQQLALASQKLRDSANQFETSVGNMLDCFGIYSAIRDESGRIVDFRIEYVNAAACDNNRMSKDEQIGKGLCEVLPAHRETGLFDEYCQVVETGQPLVKEMLVYEDVYGERQLSRAFDIRGAKLKDGFVASWRDMTERKRAEEELIKSEERFRNLFENANDSIFVSDPKTRNFINVNNKAYTRLGYSKEELLSLKLDDITPQVLPDFIQNNIKKLNRGETIVFESSHLYKDGSLMPVEISSGLTEYGGRQVIQSFVRDISVRKQAELALQKAHDELEERVVKRTAQLNTANKELKQEIIVRERAERVIKNERDYLERLRNSVGEVILTVNLHDRIITHVNKRIEDVFGYRADESIGNTTEMLHPSRKKFYDYGNMLKNAIETGKDIVETEQILKKKNGELFNAEVTTSFLKENNNVSQVISIVRDITMRKQIEAKIKSSLNEKEVLLSEVHHRVNNSLQVISSLLDMSIMRTNDQLVIDLFTDARSRIHSMALIHSQLYRNERIDQIKMESHINEMVSYLANIYGQKRGIISIVEASDILLSVTQAIPCTLILNELISNAFKHAFKKDVSQPKIKILMQRSAKDKIFIRIKDNGIGIPGGVNFYKTEKLGLKLVRNLVQKQLKGKIRIKRNKGTEFIIEFKFLRQEAEDV